MYICTCGLAITLIFNIYIYEQVYVLNIVRKQIPRHVRLVDSKLARSYQCPISLSVLYRPIIIHESEPKHTFSGPFIDEMTKISKFDPISGSPLGSDWRVTDPDLEKQLSQANACVPLTYGGKEDNSYST